MAYYAPFKDVPGSQWSRWRSCNSTPTAARGATTTPTPLAAELGKLGAVPPEVQRAIKIRQGASLERGGKHEAALALLGPIAKDENVPPQALPEAWLSMGAANLALNRNKDALLAYLHVPVYVPDRPCSWPRRCSAAPSPTSGSTTRHARGTPSAVDQRLSQFARGRRSQGPAPKTGAARRQKTSATFKIPPNILNQLPHETHPSPRQRGFAAALLLCAAAAAQAQSPAPRGQPRCGRRQAATKNLLDEIIEGGWVMFPIAACSILTVYLVGEGVTRTNPKKLAPPEQGNAVKNLFRQGDYVGAYNYCKANPSPLTNVVRIGVSYLGDGQNMTENAMSEELAKENAHLQTKLSYLSVIGVCTPMIGLLGTVTGMMSAFSTLGTSGIGDPPAGGGHRRGAHRHG